MQGRELRAAVLHQVQNEWPIHVRDVVKNLSWDPLDISNVSKVRYHFNCLRADGKIRTKKIGRALVAWPMEMEKLRVISELLRE